MTTKQKKLINLLSVSLDLVPGAFNFFTELFTEPFWKCRNHIVYLAIIPFRNHCESQNYSEKFRNHFEPQNYSEISQPFRNSEPFRVLGIFLRMAGNKFSHCINIPNTRFPLRWIISRCPKMLQWAVSSLRRAGLVYLGWIYLQHTRILVTFLTRTLSQIKVSILKPPEKLPVRNVHCF